MAWDAFTDELLSHLERREARLLGWGFYDGTFTAEAVEDRLAADAPPSLVAAWAARREAGASLAEVFASMADHGLLHRISPGRFRTRFAEGVRLIARLRQVFDASKWRTAPNLVGDLKLHLRPRRYPGRKPGEPGAASPAECWADMAPNATRPDLQRALFDALVGSFHFAGFQRRAFAHVFERYGREGPAEASVVCAGTGSGKTKAFYVPAFLRAAAETDAPPYTKVVAVYPRNVLLADQLREALAEADKIAPVLKKFGRRPLRFGALLGETPYESVLNNPANARRFYRWEQTRARDAYVVSFLRSPRGTGDELVWRDEDRRARRLDLYARGDAEPHVRHGSLAFTRDELLREPPDILFASAEMINREMGNAEWGRVLGLCQPEDRRPKLLLLDEVHAHEGTAGAMVGWVLRRWRYWARPKSLHVVGLSATLGDAAGHVGRVTGIPPHRVRVFEPRDDEMHAESQEYNLAIKGDPASGAALLSTTIQTTMLAARLLTPLREPRTPAAVPSGRDYFGRKVFGFTDNLDSLNRWLGDLTNAEAQRLARHREPPATRDPARDEAGQVWTLPQMIGHDLSARMGVGRCSSQDPGLDAGMEITVATSSLEVGFDDPAVGAVVQHKSPMSSASFLQRKGRAGRQRGHRPWTVVVLSDHGRDRWNFLQVERLFEPQLDEIRLPVGNPYVLRAQAAYFLLDWLGREANLPNGPFRDLVCPRDGRGMTDTVRRRVVDLLDDMIALGQSFDRFRRAFRGLLNLWRRDHGATPGDDELDALLWDAPRSLMLQVVPTLRRKVADGWAALGGGREDEDRRTPLPEFLPGATFLALDLNETTIRTPGGDEPMEAGRALFETCPGRASKRFAPRAGAVGNWHPFSANLAGGDVVASARDLYPDALAVGVAGAVRPVAADVVAHPGDVLESSFAAWDWRTAISAEGTPRTVHASLGAWAAVFHPPEAFVHADRAAVSVTRFARSARYEILRRRGDAVRGRLLLHRTESDGTGTDDAVGFCHHADGVRIRLRAEHLRSLPEPTPEMLARFRPDYFLHRIIISESLRGRAGTFALEALWQTSMAMLTATALRHNESLEAAQVRLSGLRHEAAARVFTAIHGGDTDGDGAEEFGRNQRAVLELWDDPASRSEVEALERLLWLPSGDDFRDWVRRRYALTLARAVRAALADPREGIDEDDLSADVVGDGDGVAVYVTEKASGGLGQIERALASLAADPSRLADGVEFALTRCPREETARHLLGAIRRADGPLAVAFAAVRSARDLAGAERVRRRLVRCLRRCGLRADRAAVSALMIRVLRPGSAVASDKLTRSVNRAWRKAERAAGVAIDPRVYAYHVAADDRARRRVARVLRAVGGAPDDAQVVALARQILLPGCEDGCPECLDRPDRYGPAVGVSRAYARAAAGLGGDAIDADARDDWPDLARVALARRGIARVRAGRKSRHAVAARLPELFASEVDAGGLLQPVRLRRIDRDGASRVFTLELRDHADAEP